MALSHHIELKDFFQSAAERIRKGYCGDADEIGGLEIEINVETDVETNPRDVGCYSEADIERWENHAWKFYTIEMEIILPDGSRGYTVGTASMAGVEHGLVEQDDVEIDFLAQQILPDLFKQAAVEVPANLKRVILAADTAKILASILEGDER